MTLLQELEEHINNYDALVAFCDRVAYKTPGIEKEIRFLLGSVWARDVPYELHEAAWRLKEAGL